MRIHLGHAILVAIAVLTMTGCALLPEPTSSSIRLPDGFVFVRDPQGVLPDAERVEAERQLASIAASTGMVGVVLVGGNEVELELTASDLIADLGERGASVVIAYCTPDLCDLTTPDLFSPDLADTVELVAPAPEPAPGQGLPPAERGLRAWVEYVGAIAFVE